ncbi:hypothetical protein DVH05_011746 [Phytophthora capsici]|nr:hypothetical protein DVH05_011746 [Phytophthora capsici]
MAQRRARYARIAATATTSPSATAFATPGTPTVTGMAAWALSSSAVGTVAHCHGFRLVAREIWHVVAMEHVQALRLTVARAPKAGKEETVPREFVLPDARGSAILVMIMSRISCGLNAVGLASATEATLSVNVTRRTLAAPASSVRFKSVIAKFRPLAHISSFVVACGGTDVECNGFGECLTLNDLAPFTRVNGVTRGFTYGEDPNDVSTWDARRIRTCLCDPLHFGYDCSLSKCLVFEIYFVSINLLILVMLRGMSERRRLLH